MLSKDNNLSTPRSNTNCLNTSQSVELPFMLSILRTLKDHFDSVNRTQYNNVAPIDELFKLFHQLINCYLQLNLPVKSKQNYIKASTTITNTLKDDISLFLDNHFIKENNKPQQVHSICNSCFSVLNISKEASFLLHNGSRNGNGVESFLNCEELSNEDIIEKIKQKIEKKNDIPSQYNSLPLNLHNNNNTNVKHNNNSNKVNAQTIFTPVKDIKLRSVHNKQQANNVNSANANNQKTKKGGKAAKSISINTTETPVSNNNTTSYIKERTLSVPCKKDKTKAMTNLTQLNNNNNNQSSNKINNTKQQQQQQQQPTQTHTIQNINVNVNNTNNTKHKNLSAKKISAKELPSTNGTTLNMSVDKKNNLNHSFNHSSVRSHRHYSVPSQPNINNNNNNNNNHLRTFSNTSSSLNKQTIPKKEEPTLSTTTMVPQPTTNNPNNQPDKTNTSSINDFSKLNSTFVCTTVKTGNVVQKYTLNTKANQNVPKASRYANSLLSKYKGLIAAYNVGQVPNKK